jgi:hypothetical protein
MKGTKLLIGSLLLVLLQTIGMSTSVSGVLKTNTNGLGVSGGC